MKFFRGLVYLLFFILILIIASGGSVGLTVTIDGVAHRITVEGLR